MAKLNVQYFSKSLQYTFLFLSIGVTYFLFANDYWRTIVFLFLIGVFLFTRKFQISIDKRKGLIIDKSQAFGLNYKIRKTKFKQLKNIQIDKKRHHYNATSRGKTGVTDYFEYVGSIVYDGSKTYEIRRSIDYKTMRKEIQLLAEELNIGVQRNF